MASRAKATLTPLTAEQRSDIKETFALFDIDGYVGFRMLNATHLPDMLIYADTSHRNGCMDAGDLAVAMQALGCEPRREELRRLLDEADPEGTGSIPYDVFYKVSSFPEPMTPCQLHKLTYLCPPIVAYGACLL